MTFLWSFVNARNIVFGQKWKQRKSFACSNFKPRETKLLNRLLSSWPECRNNDNTNDSKQYSSSRNICSLVCQWRQHLNFFNHKKKVPSFHLFCKELGKGKGSMVWCILFAYGGLVRLIKYFFKSVFISSKTTSGWGDKRRQKWDSVMPRLRERENS